MALLWQKKILLADGLDLSVRCKRSRSMSIFSACHAYMDLPLSYLPRLPTTLDSARAETPSGSRRQHRVDGFPAAASLRVATGRWGGESGARFLST